MLFGAPSRSVPPVILVIEDHEDTLEMIADFLRWQGAHPIGASSVTLARELLDGLQVDVVITDYAMPGGDGVTFLRELRARERHASLPVVMVSGQASPDIVFQARELGAHYLPKPLDFDVLSTTLRALLT